ncbi:hypothetical protein EW145_g5122 [Phellinidium pouzarii]|uniref:D-lactate dehydrogenase (cytochrome) n=1 Tax=Phellinidium pouzarii TaxID=167371 RepID=A0A4S4L149_9AGAM|nr:hypothetical protein EW145_g5122 [Phellinidium pouzarii]
MFRRSVVVSREFSSRQTPVLHASRRLSSRSYTSAAADSQKQGPTGTPPWSGHALSFLLGSLGILGLSYYFLRPDPSSWNPQSLKVKYGSANDFQTAVRVLCLTFPEDGVLHSVVVYPLCTEDVVKIVNIATKYKMPIIPYSGGTSLEGHTRGHKYGGICVDMSRMDRILEINGEDSLIVAEILSRNTFFTEADADLVCQAGIRWVDINDTLKEKDIPLFFPEQRSAVWLAQAAQEHGLVANAVRYGTAKGEWFLNLTVVLPSGKVIKTRRRARKSSAGFDTSKIFIGAEGTLGIVTEATLRLTPLLPTSVAVVHFPDVKHATEAVRDALTQGVGIQCVELCDDSFMHATNLYGLSKRKWPEKDSLFFKFQGHSAEALRETARVVKKVAERYGGTGFTLARNDKEAADLWMDRKNAHFSGLALVEGGRSWATDVWWVFLSSVFADDVFLSQSCLTWCMRRKKDLKEAGVISSIVGHAGDGNFHAQLLFKDDSEMEKIREVVHRMVKRAIALDGTCTGEHGVGLGKKAYLNEELGEGTVELMKTIKRTLDPLGLFNPGKLYPDEPADSSSKSHS